MNAIERLRELEACYLSLIFDLTFAEGVVLCDMLAPLTTPPKDQP